MSQLPKGGASINNNNRRTTNNSARPTTTTTIKTPSELSQVSRAEPARVLHQHQLSEASSAKSTGAASKVLTPLSTSRSLEPASTASKQQRATINEPQNSGATPTQHQQQQQRISSIDILNENKQRQLQFKQQESFKLHLEQRQRLIQEQNQTNTSGDETSVTYQVNTSAPDYYMAAAAKKAPAAAAAAAAATNTGSGISGSQSGGLALNPFDEPERQHRSASAAAAAATTTAEATTLSGKSGFLSALMDEASYEEGGVPGKFAGTNRANADEEELDSAAGGSSTRYSKVAASGALSYNYDEPSNKKPFYERDLATLLQDCRSSRKLVIVIVAIALLLDNMLLTSVVPIIPAHLYRLRIERQHREQLENNKSLWLANSNQDGSAPSKLDGEGRVDGFVGDSDQETLLEMELARRINQSLADVKDRFSGSVFHPKVRMKTKAQQLRQRQRQDNDDDDDDDDDDDRDDDDDDDGAEEVNQSGKMRNRQSNSNSLASTNRKHKNDQDDDYITPERDQDDEDEGSEKGGKSRNSANGEDENEEKKGSMRTDFKVSNSRKIKVTKPKQENDDDDDDDDDIVSNSRRSTKMMADDQEEEETDDEDVANAADARRLYAISRLSGDSNPLASMSKSKANDSLTDRRDSSSRRPSKTPATTRRPKVTKVANYRAKSQKPAKVGDEMAKKPQLEPEPSKEGEEEELVISHQDIVDESFEVGVMFASKPIVQAFANPFIGTLTNRVGFTIPMFTGFVIMFLSTLVFAFGNSYSTLFIARAIQGVGSACTSVAGMSMLADRFPDDAERGNAMAIALGGLALGVVIGPPFGGFMYEFIGKSSPFIVLSILALLDGLLQLMVLQPRVTTNQEEGPSLMTLIKDPYILVAAGAITFANTGIAILEPALPLWMMDTMKAKNWEQGVAFLPAALSYMFGTNLFGNLGLRIGRWRATMIGLIIIGCALLMIPFATRVDHLIIPNGAIGFAMGMVDSTMMPMLGYLVDIRHTSVYGSVYAIGDVAFCASFAFGPALSGTLVELVGFKGLIITTSFICFAFAPLLLLLRDPPARQVNEAQLQEQSTLRYVNYNHLDSPDEEAQLTAGEHKSSAKSYVR